MVMLCLAALIFAACGVPKDEVEGPAATPATTEQGGTECEDRTPPAPEKDSDTAEKPDVKIPDGAPPCELVIQDIKDGTGTEAEAGSTVTAHYVGVSWSSGEEFDSSWSRGEPTAFPLANVIQGWQQGIPGMKEGGRRRLIIPPELAYGAQPPPGSGIAPNETLVFVIDLVSVD
jgi:peptidylprolyl isomerase